MQRFCSVPRRLPLPLVSRRALGQPAPAGSPSLVSSVRDVLYGPQAQAPPPVPAFPASSLVPSRPTRVTTLPNGLRVASESVAGSGIASVGLWVDTGSRYENSDNNGTAHFLEHMAFKGTSSQSQAELDRMAENKGMAFNAFTSREHTSYVATCFQNDANQALRVLGDIVQNPLLKSEAIDRERGVILREMEEVDLQHKELVFDKAHECAFRGTSLARPIIGSPENVKSITREDLAEFIKTHYSADRMVISAAGAVDHDALCEVANEVFSSLPPSAPDNVRVHDGGVPFFIGSDVRMREDAMEDCHCVLAFQGLPWAHADTHVVSVMVSILGAWDAMAPNKDTAGKLARAVGEDNLGKMVMPFSTPYNDTGLFGVHTVSSGEQLPELMWNVQEEITRLCFEVTEEDVQRAVNQVKAATVGALDNSQSVFEDIGRQMLTVGRRVSLQETFARLDSITAADVNRVALDLVYDKDVVLSAVGPTVKLPDYAKLRRRTYWLRY